METHQSRGGIGCTPRVSTHFRDGDTHIFFFLNAPKKGVNERKQRVAQRQLDYAFF